MRVCIFPMFIEGKEKLLKLFIHCHVNLVIPRFHFLFRYLIKILIIKSIGKFNKVYIFWGRIEGVYYYKVDSYL